MRDVKIGFLVAIPAAVTILSIVWFLRKKSGKNRDERKRKKEDSPPDVRNIENEQILNQSKFVEENGITLTQRKIPEIAARKRGPKSLGDGAPDTIAGPINDVQMVSGNETNQRPLTESEKEKVKEIVESAIEAGLKQAKTECQENEIVPEVQEEMMVASAAPVQHCVNETLNVLSDNNRAIPTLSDNNMAKCSSLLVNNNSCNNSDPLDNLMEYLKPLENNGDPSSTVPKPHSSSSVSLSSQTPSVTSPTINATTTQLSLSADKDLSYHQSSSAQGELKSLNNSQLGSVSCNDNISTTPPNNTITAASSADWIDLSSSPSPSNNTTKDSALDDSMSDSKPDQQVESALCESSCSSSKPSESDLGSSKVRDPSIEQQSRTSEDSSANSNSPVCDSNSVGSNDSGRGGSEQDTSCQSTEALIHFDFNMPSELCGRLIGRHGKNINYIKTKSGASVSLTNNPLTADFQICQVVGSQTEIDEALAMIRGKFPLVDNPRLTMTPITLTMPKQMEQASVLVPDNMQLSLPEGASVEVYVSTIVDAGHVFIQQPTHRSFMSLEKLNYFLNSVYSQDESIPSLPTPVECGVICVCENEGCWYRAMVMSPEDEFGECQVKFVDYGGYAQFPLTRIKQIRADFMNLPFQAVECFMANISPLQGEEFFSADATMALSEMSQLKLLQCQVVARNEMGTPYIHLYLVDGDTNTATLVNRALVNSGLVRWVEIL